MRDCNVLLPILNKEVGERACEIYVSGLELV